MLDFLKLRPFFIISLSSFELSNLLISQNIGQMRVLYSIVAYKKLR